MKPQQIAWLRMANQLITGSTNNSAKEVVSRMGALQAQDYHMAKWAVGLRMQKGNLHDVDHALDKGEIIRTHVLRPTWHIISAEDIYWMLDLTGPKILAAMKSRNKQLELTEETFNKSNHILESALRDNNHLTRPALVKLLNDGGIATDDNRASHLLMHAELTQVICSGKAAEGQVTYALLPERVAPQKRLYKGEALAALATKYFSSHGPATLEDFKWWSGLSTTEARAGLELAKPSLVSEHVGGQHLWFNSTNATVTVPRKSVHLLPAFDEYLVSYKDRSAAIMKAHHAAAMSVNGIFWPVVVQNGRALALWKRTVKKEALQLHITAFNNTKPIPVDAITKPAKRLAKFLGLKLGDITT